MYELADALQIRGPMTMRLTLCCAGCPGCGGAVLQSAVCC